MYIYTGIKINRFRKHIDYIICLTDDFIVYMIYCFFDYRRKFRNFRKRLSYRQREIGQKAEMERKLLANCKTIQMGGIVNRNFICIKVK